MGNTTQHSAPSSPSGMSVNRQNSTAKQVHISTNHADGFYFTGERLTGTVKIPTSFLHSHLQNKNNSTSTELFNKRSLRNPIIIELVGDATYSAEIDVAADSDGHVTHKINLCRQCSIVTMHQNKTELQTIESSTSSSDTKSRPTNPSSVLNGTFHLHIPDGLPPSLSNNRTPSVVYTLDLSLSSSRYRYQIPITLSTRGYISHPMTDIKLSDTAVNKNDICLRAYSPRNYCRPGEQISVQINYSNPQQRSIRSITVQLVQFYRIHSDQNYSLLDGKEWTFDIATVLPSTQWSGEAHLQLPNQPLQASYPASSVGTTRAIECELHYRILIDLNEKKGDDINLILAPIHVTYQK
ncbi:unnamed protein product [Rotaria socialis]|uniref:Arrestin C-terminal-like domain-containing protein n=1 Tax=Rotaria socialis TaxID=392032 RepID=A0A818UUK6_9BILA|nr:unnamed protein product [Rotaria socialis]CAF3365507.1 unnamed protein product [Rotaria socialis]CAF3440884.1 unnamed protein product [Rotaria socialis]CAF3686837.1 unnamed protein product [Rotaria socialis]CAF3706127.1 unnamed protein product [Rotaria socialis]